jgi:hypothetical protein
MTNKKGYGYYKYRHQRAEAEGESEAFCVHRAEAEFNVLHSRLSGRPRIIGRTVVRIPLHEKPIMKSVLEEHLLLFQNI